MSASFAQALLIACQPPVQRAFGLALNLNPNTCIAYARSVNADMYSSLHVNGAAFIKRPAASAVTVP